jgi:hypothetical protein
VLTKFEEFCNKRDPVMALRAQFWSYSRPDGQGLDAFVNNLRTMANNCKFQDIDTTLRDKLFFSITDTNMKLKVMGDDGNASLDAVLNLMRAYESAKRELQMAGAQASGTSSVVHAMQDKSRNKQQQRPHQPHQTQYPQTSKNATANPCSRCGTTHPPRRCPAKE